MNVIVFLLTLLLLGASPKGPLAGSSPKPFQEGVDLFQAGRYQDALLKFDTTLRSFPAYEPATIYYARSLYHLERTQESFVMFSRVNPHSLDADAAYEYGLVFYGKHAWEGALLGFRKVPADHPQYDLANYYGAIAATKLRRYDIAEDMLDKAVVLPDKFIKSRQLYQKHIHAMKYAQEKAELARAEKKKLPLGVAPPPKEAAAPPPYAHKGFLSIDRTGELFISKDQQFQEFGEYQTSDADAQIVGMNLINGPILAVPTKYAGDRQPAFGICLKLSAEDRQKQGQTQRLIAFENSMDLAFIYIDSTSEPYAHTKEGKAGGESWFEFPFGATLWAGLGGGITYLFPEFDTGKRSGVRRGFGLLGHKTSNWELKYMGAFDQVVHINVPILADVTSHELESKTIFDKIGLFLGIGAFYKAYRYGDTSLSGPDETLGGKLVISQNLPFRSGVSLVGVYQKQNIYLKDKVSKFNLLFADANIITGKLEFETRPFAWIKAYSRSLVEKSQWTVNSSEDPAAQEAFDRTVPSFTTTFQFGLAINVFI